MTTPSASRKGGSRWGSLLSGAVAGIESRLDTILAEDSEASARSRAAEKAAAEKAVAEKATAEKATKTGTSRPTTPSIDGSQNLSISSQNASRDASRNRANERLQERLAKAINRDADSLKSPRSSADLPSRSASPLNAASSVTGEKLSQLPTHVSTVEETKLEESNKEEERTKHEEDTVVVETQVPAPSLLSSRLPINPSRDSIDSTSTRPSLEAPPQLIIENNSTSADANITSTYNQAAWDQTSERSNTENEEGVLSQRTQQEHEAELERLRTEHRDEMNANLERIDALQSKLALLARSAAVTAQQASQSANVGSSDQKIAERDARIAQLLEEGTKLSATEIKHLGLIKKLRGRISEEEKSRDDFKRKLSKAESTSQEANERARRAEAEVKIMGDKTRGAAKAQGELDALKAERDGQGITILNLQSQVEESRQRAEDAEKKAQSGAVEAKRRAADDMAEQLENAKIEKKLLEERLRAEIKQVEENSKRKEEQARVSDIELKAEIANLESKIELLRTRTEEASSNATGDSQAKLLRQIETLQTQYALANENWQGIESSLTSRVAALEKERDETARRESDIRRKARDMGIKTRTLEEDLEVANERRNALEQDLESVRPQIQKLQDRSKDVEATFAKMRADFERERQVWESDLRRKIQEEKAKWQLELHAAQEQAMVDQKSTYGRSTFSSRKGSAADISNLYSRRSQTANRNASSELSIPGLTDRERRPSLRPPSARSPSFPSGTPISPSPPRRQNSSASLTNGSSQPQVNTNNGLIPPTPPTAIPSSMIPLSAIANPPTPSINTNATDLDSIVDTGASSSPTRRSATVADVLSASTVGTGPSVQLVERMSSAVRRLESEKASLRDELSRLSSQRDEARNEVVALMNEVEAKRTLETRVTALEAEKQGVEDRYGAALEMLGEKSEMVEELKADIQDLKKIYRELVENTTR
ncbi:MAG: hypothetical protein M1820_000629 [Bogoriella megaspora]|nr:MAG: hypothetical protein M1820_000629 [Bogoriella megaspora]